MTGETHYPMGVSVLHPKQGFVVQITNLIKTGPSVGHNTVSKYSISLRCQISSKKFWANYSVNYSSCCIFPSASVGPQLTCPLLGDRLRDSTVKWGNGFGNYEGKRGFKRSTGESPEALLLRERFDVC